MDLDQRPRMPRLDPTLLLGVVVHVAAIGWLVGQLTGVGA